MLNFLRIEDDWMEYVTAGFKVVHVEGAIVDYLYSPQEETILRGNTPHCLFHRDLALGLL